MMNLRMGLGFPICLLLSIGCSSESESLPEMETYPLQGTVSQADGQPLADAVIEFQPVEDAQANGLGQVEDGNFDIKFMLAGGSYEGVPTGEYRVNITILSTTDGGQGNPVTVTLPETVTIDGETRDLQLILPGE